MIAFESEIYDSYIPLEEICASFIRVVFVVATPLLSRRLLCLAFHYKMFFPHYQWVFETKIDEDFYETRFTYSGINYKCSDEDIHTALKGALNIFNRVAINDNSSVTISGQTVEGYKESYKSYIKSYCENEITCVSNTYSPWASVTYDSVWALAVALNKSLNEFHNISTYLRGTILQRKITNMLQISMLDVEFQGVTGRVKFNKQTHFIEPHFSLLQYNDKGFSQVKMIYSDDKLILPGTDPHFIKSSFETKYMHLPLSATLLIMLCSSLILLATHSYSSSSEF